MKKKKITILIIFSAALLTLQGCGYITDYFEELFTPNLMIIRGQKTVSGAGEVFTVPPGTTVEFRSLALAQINGELLITGGSKLIAQGTAEEPIIFKSNNTGGIIYFDTSASTASVVEYCNFDDTDIKMLNSTNIQHCKFSICSIELYFAITPTIQYNSFEGTTAYSESSQIISRNGENEYNLAPIIRYNNFTTIYNFAIYFYEGENPIIEYNNITNCEEFAIYHASNNSIQYTVNNNYISNCNGLTGLDTTGEQSHNITYSSYKSTFISEAGAGW